MPSEILAACLCSAGEEATGELGEGDSDGK